MRKTQSLAFAAMLLLLPGLSGCGQFFPKPPPPCTTNCTTTNNFLYVANTVSTAPSIAGFTITGTATAPSLNVAPGSAYTLSSLIPSAMAITPNNKFLYVALPAGGILLYAINSDGGITLQNNSNPVAANGILPAAIRIDTTGGWLVVANVSRPGVINPSMQVYAIDPNSGLLTATGNPLNITRSGSTGRMTFSPNNATIYVTLGTGGVEIIGFNATTGGLTDMNNLAPKVAQGAGQGVAVDPTSTYFFVTETAGTGLRVFKIGTNPLLAEVSGSPFATGQGPGAVMVDTSGSYVYVANSTDNTISGYVLAANGTVTAIAGSPFATGTSPVDLAEDTSKSFVAVACSGGNHDLELYNFDATTGGKLDSVAHATTGTDPTNAIAVVATH